MNSQRMAATAVAKQAGLGVLALLGILTAFDSMAIDMYLPAFPVIRDELGLAAGTMQMSLSVFLIGLAAGQAVSGPLADSYGRKTPLLCGIVVFAAASGMIALTSSASVLMAGRFLQGVGGAAGLVIPRAIVSDLYESSQSTKIFSLLVQIQSISPIIAPPLGSILLAGFGWRSIFWVLVVFGFATFFASLWIIPETGRADRSERATPWTMLKTYGLLFKNPRYLGMTLSAGLVMGALFGYVSGSAFVFMNHFGLSSHTYSLLFAAVSIGMIAVGQLNFVLCKRMSARRHLGLGFAVHIFFLFALLAAVLLGLDSLYSVAVILFFAMSSMSLIFGGITAASIYSVPNEHAGTASALLGVMQYAFGGLAGVILGILQGTTLLPFAIVLAASSTAAILVWMRTERRYPQPEAATE